MPIPGGNRKAERTPDKLSLLRNHPLFRDLPPPVIKHLGSYMKTRQVARGTAIFAKGDPGSGLMGVLAGTVKVSVASADGKDIVLNLFQRYSARSPCSTAVRAPPTPPPCPTASSSSSTGATSFRFSAVTPK